MSGPRNPEATARGKVRHLHDHPHTRFALLYVGGDGTAGTGSITAEVAGNVYAKLGGGVH